jgi:hypothetical protein
MQGIQRQIHAIEREEEKVKRQIKGMKPFQLSGL